MKIDLSYFYLGMHSDDGLHPLSIGWMLTQSDKEGGHADIAYQIKIKHIHMNLRRSYTGVE